MSWRPGESLRQQCPRYSLHSHIIWPQVLNGLTCRRHWTGLGTHATHTGMHAVPMYSNHHLMPGPRSMVPTPGSSLVQCSTLAGAGCMPHMASTSNRLGQMPEWVLRTAESQTSPNGCWIWHAGWEVAQSGPGGQPCIIHLACELVLCHSSGLS